MDDHIESKISLPKLTKCLPRFPLGLRFNYYVSTPVKLLHAYSGLQEKVVVNVIPPVVGPQLSD